MCTAPRPKAPAIPAPRQAARAPDEGISTMNSDQLRRRTTMQSMILTPQTGMGAAPVAAKQVLGA